MCPVVQPWGVGGAFGCTRARHPCRAGGGGAGLQNQGSTPVADPPPPAATKSPAHTGCVCALLLQETAATVFPLAHKYNVQSCLGVCTRLVLANLSDDKTSKCYVLRWLDTADSLGHAAMKTA